MYYNFYGVHGSKYFKTKMYWPFDELKVFVFMMTDKDVVEKNKEIFRFSNYI